MFYKFIKLDIHNFLSFGDASINLTDKGYCLICGKNNNPLDRALSNGSGKSSIISAISWVLTGETIQGVKSNIENINTQGGCFVRLTFEANRDKYEIARYKNHEIYKTDLKIFLNDEDISGKGIRESENILAQRLPNLDTNLLSSVILLGQGLPNSLTKNTPSGRKELLEKLTQSDFMIQDIKQRINKRSDELSVEKRNYEDKLIELNTTKNIYSGKLSADIENLNINFNDSIDFDKEISNIESLINEVSKTKILNESLLADSTNKYNEKTTEYLSVYQEFKDNLDKAKDKLNTNILVLTEQLSTAKAEAQNKADEIKKLNSIKDICPTCGQKIPGVLKPDTSVQSAELVELTKKINDIDRDIKNQKALTEKIIAEINNSYNPILCEIQSSKNALNTQNNSLTKQLSESQEYIKKLEIELTLRKNEKQTYNQRKTNLLQAIENGKKELNDIEAKILYNIKIKEKLEQHLEIVSKLQTYVKRDFRGYLLSDILIYLEKKAKEYARYLFNSDNIVIYLDGNNIDIKYCDKLFESLSGGEQQKVNLIIQFAIRELLSVYLDFHSNILFLDEITDNLDSVSCDGIINLISNILSDLESIFIISHHEDELSLPIDNVLVVEKNDKGISRIL